ncbi:MAG: CHAT domain-containing protein, partial [Bacteroidia bacterium]
VLVRSVIDQLYKPAGFGGFAEASRALYQAIFPHFDNIEQARDLLICPDGLMGYVPFSCLLTEDIELDAAATSSVYRSLPYLQNTYSTRYAYGAALHFQSYKASASNRMLAFAPEYEGERRLAFNKPQAIAIADRWDGDLFLAQDAQETRFRQSFQDYDILHLAQHGEANLEQPLASRLRFSLSGDTVPEHDGMLHAYEIYALEIPAKLVVLASCESGYGPLAQGEGVMSLARAFRSAGAQSVLNTAWEVDGRVAMPLMEAFYDQLADGKTPSRALRDSRSDFLQSAPPELVHPHYWAAFTMIGADKTITRSQGYLPPLLLFVALVAIAGFGMTRKPAA